MTLPAPTIEVGTTCLWSSERRDSRDHPIGGVVVERTVVYPLKTDNLGRHGWLVLDPFNTRTITTHVLSEDEIGPDGVEAVEPGRLVFLIRRLCKELGTPAHFYQLEDRERDYLRWLGVLVEAEAELRGRV